MNSPSQSQPVAALRGAVGKPEPSAATDFHVVNRYGVTIATADSEDLAIATAKRLRLQFSGLTVQRVTVTTERKVVYRPRVVS